MKYLIYILFTLISSISFGQDYLIINESWQNKIKQNYQLAPLFYGVNRSKSQLKDQSNFVKQEVSKYTNTDSAFNEHYKLGWNYFNIGITDSAIIEFNNCYLLKSEDLRLITAFSNVLTYLNGEPDYNNLNSETYPNYRLIDILKFEEKSITGWNTMIAFGDGIFIDKLKNLHQSSDNYSSIEEALDSIKPPYEFDSIGNINVKLRFDRDEGYYKQGLKNGTWVRYCVDTALIDFEYNLVDGIRNGVTTSYYKNGIKRTEFSHINGIISGQYKYYDKNGELIRIDFWENNSMNPENTIKYKDTHVEGDVFQEKDENGVLKTYIIINGEKSEL
jgi:hypothetical protein